jgi:hypothetical protein
MEKNMKGKLVMKYKIMTSLLLSTLAWNSAQADVLVLGNETALIATIAEQYNQNIKSYNGESTVGDLLYANLESVPLDDYQQLKNAVVAGQLVVLDVSGFSTEEERLSVTKQITGLGMTSPVLVSGIYNGEIILNAIVSDVTDENGNTTNNSEAEQESLSLSLKHSLNRLNFGDK